MTIVKSIATRFVIVLAVVFAVITTACTSRPETSARPATQTPVPDPTSTPAITFATILSQTTQPQSTLVTGTEVTPVATLTSATLVPTVASLSAADQSRELVKRARAIGDNPTAAAILALAAHQISPSDETRQLLAEFVTTLPPTRRNLCQVSIYEEWTTVDDVFTVSPSGRWAACVGNGGVIELWDLTTWQKQPIALTHAVQTSVRFSPDERYLASIGGDGAVWTYNIATAQQKVYPLPDQAESDDYSGVRFSPDGRGIVLMFGIFNDIKAIVWNVETTEIVFYQQVYPLVFSPDGRWAASGGTWENRRIELWDTTTWAQVAELRDVETWLGSDGVSPVAFSPDGNWMLIESREFVGDGNTTYQVWEWASGMLFPSYTVQRSSATAIAPDWKWVVAGGYFGDGVTVWDPRTGQPLAHKSDQTCYVKDLAISPDGNLIISIGASAMLHNVECNDNSILLWEATTGKTLLRTEYNPPAWNGGFSPDGRWMLIGDTVRAVATDQEYLRIEPPGMAAFSPDGKWVYSLNNQERLIQFWPLPQGDTVSDLCMRISRNLTPDEWVRYAGADISYQTVCQGIIP